MTTQYKVKPGDLMKVWSMHRGAEQKQLTIRVPLEIFYKVQAVEEMFAGKSRNEIVSDLLATALDEFEESLPCEWAQGQEIGWDEINNEPIHAGIQIGPKADFHEFVEKARSALVKAGELKSVETEGDVA